MFPIFPDQDGSRVNEDDQIVVSVGPYTFLKERQFPDKGRIVGRNASPPTRKSIVLSPLQPV